MNKMHSKENIEQPIKNGIREATLDDAFAIAKISYDGWTKSFRGSIDDEYLDTMDLNKIQERRAERMKNDKKIHLVYVKDGKVVGFVYGGEKRDDTIHYEAEIYAMYVDPGTQGQGVGKALMNAIGEIFHSKNKKSFYLRTLRDRPETRGFYEKLGGKVFTEKESEIGGKKYSMVGYYRQK